MEAYAIGDVFATTRRVELMKKKKSIVTVLDLKHQGFIIHVAVFSIESSNEMYSSWKAQIV